MTNKELYLKALGHHTSNANEVINEVWDNDDWSNVQLIEALEHWNLELLKSATNSLYEDFQEIRDYK